MLSIVWFRRDLRCEDHPALYEAIKRQSPILPLFICPESPMGKWPLGAASRSWLHDALVGLQTQLIQLNSKLIVAKGEYLLILKSIIEKTQADSLYFNRSYEPDQIKWDKKITAELSSEGIYVESCNDLLCNPQEIRSQSGTVYKVFTPFYKAFQKQVDVAKPHKNPKKLASPSSWPKSLAIDDLNLLPKIKWDTSIKKFWKPTQDQAKKNLKQFSENAVENYIEDRDQPALRGGSCLSPYLAFGQISPRVIYHHLQNQYKKSRNQSHRNNVEAFLRQLVWREFAYNILIHFPNTTDKSLDQRFDQIKWKTNKKHLMAWQKGLTGYPIVDAGMRQLWKVGWMHNRVRMIVASFLVKDCQIHWRQGARWFWDTLVDADLANNSLGWQWAAGSGADAAPYYRVFNPILQGKKFDPEGNYVKKFLPELKDLPKRWIHEPFNAPENILQQAGITLGKNYPNPIVDHNQARLDYLAFVKESRDETK